jgi:tripartite-type tricarboxylate transporter receptor subunit TctC
VKDLAPVTQVLSTPLILIAHPSLPAKNAKDLIAIARAKPDAITYGSPGNGSLGHLAAEMIKNPQGNRKVVEGDQGCGGQG